jgi:hypothetical protein
MMDRDQGILRSKIRRVISKQHNMGTHFLGSGLDTKIPRNQELSMGNTTTTTTTSEIRE